MTFRTPALALGLLAAATAASGTAQDQSTQGVQDELVMTLNDGADDPDALTFDWPMLSIGTGQYEAGPTGVTVIRFGRKVHGAVDVRGGGPGTVNAPYLDLGYVQPELDAVVLAGGSWYGLEAVTAVNTAMKDDGYRGGHWNNVGLAVGSIIYDFGGRRLNEIYPDKRLAQAAYRAARPGVFPVGPYGAGRSAMTGGLFGCNARSGQGAAFRQIGEVKIAVFTVVNALGVVTDRDGKVVACHAGSGWPEDLAAHELLNASPASLRPDWDGERAAEPERKNTTISLVVTNRSMSSAELKRLAVQVHTSMARGIQPFATELDGDVLYAVSTGEVESGPGDGLVTAEIGAVASELMWDAILSSVPEQPSAPSPRQARDTTPDLQSFVGTYRFSPLASLEVTAEGGRLFGQATGERDIFAIRKGEPVELQPSGPSQFVIPGRYPFSVRFEGDKIVVNPGRWQQVGMRP
ncbi:P1 family peptidase [Pelagerythrobacter aerophilus]|uniref:Peptidase S58 DmpA n=1 Tax=Pelagerythrobacter aerophilus TaxID=2306995 RepID=A0A418NIT9_9SPHN|nr:P1 family peptidase [Pelagerythrobacter aerophilus]RIV79215.1 peptidase S58 DmpA [Pelagerythrobacter aerophilus]